MKRGMKILTLKKYNPPKVENLFEELDSNIYISKLSSENLKEKYKIY